MHSRRNFLTRASALGLVAGLTGWAEAQQFNTPQGRAVLGGAGIPQPPAGFGWVSFNNATGQFTLATTGVDIVAFTDPSTGQQRPVMMSLNP